MLNHKWSLIRCCMAPISNPGSWRYSIRFPVCRMECHLESITSISHFHLDKCPSSRLTNHLRWPYEQLWTLAFAFESLSIFIPSCCPVLQIWWLQYCYVSVNRTSASGKRERCQRLTSFCSFQYPASIIETCGAESTISRQPELKLAKSSSINSTKLKMKAAADKGRWKQNIVCCRESKR